MKKTNLIISCLSMGIVVASANVLVQYQINDFLTWGAITFPITFMITDVINRYFGVYFARKVVLAGFITGALFSLNLAPIRIAIASVIAFLISQLLDIKIFDNFRNGFWFKAPLISTLVSGLVDTSLFFFIAFYGTDVPWHTLILGDTAVKYAINLVLFPIYGIIVMKYKTKYVA